MGVPELDATIAGAREEFLSLQWKEGPHCLYLGLGLGLGSVLAVEGGPTLPVCAT